MFCQLIVVFLLVSQPLVEGQEDLITPLLNRTLTGSQGLELLRSLPLTGQVKFPICVTDSIAFALGQTIVPYVKTLVIRNGVITIRCRTGYFPICPVLDFKQNFELTFQDCTNNKCEGICVRNPNCADLFQVVAVLGRSVDVLDFEDRRQLKCPDKYTRHCSTLINGNLEDVDCESSGCEGYCVPDLDAYGYL